MSYYDDRRTNTRETRRRSDDYYDDSVYANTRENQRSTAIVRRRSDSPDYDEEVRRDFSPGGRGYYRETITRKSGVRPADRARSYDNGRYDDDRSFASTRRDSSYGGAARRRDDHDDRDRRRRSRYESDYSSRSRSRTPPKRERRKSMPEQALEAIGLGGLAATIMGKKSRSRSRSSSSGRRSNRSRNRRGRSNSPDHRKEQLQQALKAAVLAGAASAFRARNEQGGWGGEKGRRVLTSALTAAGVDGFVNRDKDPEKHKFRDTIGSAIAGVATDRIVNGPASRTQSRGPNGSPDRRGSRSRSRVGDLAAGGAIAAAAKKISDSVRGRSASRGRDHSVDSYDSRDSRGSRAKPGVRARSRSVIARGLSKMGLDGQADRVDPAGARERSVSRGGGRRRRDSRSRSRSRYADDDFDDRRQSLYDPPNNFNGRGSSVNYDNRDVGKSRSLDPHSGAMINRPNSVGPGGGILSPPPAGYQYDTRPHQNGDPETDSDSDLGSSTDDEKKRKKGRKRLLISGGLATVATIHAGHSVHQSMEKRQARVRAVRDGTISKEEAKKHKSRDRLQDAASLGLAALGIKGAYSEWKEVKEHREEEAEEREKHDRHARKRSARRQKLGLVGMNGDYSNSAPTLSNPFYQGDGYDDNGRRQYYGPNGLYMSGANGEYQQPSPMRNGGNNTTQYFDDNPYSSFQQGGGYNHDQPAYGNTYGGSQYPPPPGAQPPPPV